MHEPNLSEIHSGRILLASRFDAARDHVVPALGGSVDGNAWLMLTICPLTIAWPASAFTFWQSERLKNAHRDLARAHAQLAAAHRRLEEKASRDNMTGMLNRESFFAALDGSRRKTDRGALLIIDADHFKKINDNFGHLTGDTALLEIAAAISRAIRRRRHSRPHRRRGVRRIPGRGERPGGGAGRRARPPRGGADPLPADWTERSCR